MQSSLFHILFAQPSEKRATKSKARQSFMANHQTSPLQNLSVHCLNDDEISEFIDGFDTREDGYIDYRDIDHKLDQAHQELVLRPASDLTTTRDESDARGRYAFLRSMIDPELGEHCIARDKLAERIRGWKIPSLQEFKKQEDEEKNYFKRLPSWRKIRAYWAVHGPEIAFIGLVAALQIAIGVWQFVAYSSSYYVGAFSWGLPVAKACAGALYPTFFFLLLSTSRYFSTLLRKYYYISRFFNWDLSQAFHIRIAYVALVLTTIHALGHLTGTFVHGSDSANRALVASEIGPGKHYYIDYIRSVPGFTGIAGLGLFYIMFLSSLPRVRRWEYNIFQLGHLLAYPIIGLMMAHGTAALFRRPIFGYLLAFPVFLILFERVSRVCLGFRRFDATLEVLDGEAVEITATVPIWRLWNYTAGQHIFLQVPQISFFQWHPFTISFCRGNKMMVHIKTDGDWTSKLRQLGGPSGVSAIQVGINGPFGAPAQRFYDFRHSIVIGAGIGITPFSAILADLQHNHDLDQGSPEQRQTGSHGNQQPSPIPDPEQEPRSPDRESLATNTLADNYRRTDFHWLVRDGNYLMWLTDLLNKVSVSQKWHREHDAQSHLDIRINTHVTAKRSNITTYIYSWLLEMHRTTEHPTSPLTGLLNPTRFGRPDFNKILDEHYQEMCGICASKTRQAKQRAEEKTALKGTPRFNSSNDCHKVGVFYCGAPAIGEILADKCSELTLRGREDGSKIEYYFMTEVFD